MKTVALVLLLAAIALAAYVQAGLFNPAADHPHSQPVLWLLQTARERSIARRAAGIAVPPLDDPRTIAAGAVDYAEMCTGCHLAPGVGDTEARTGMYPQPPELARGPPRAPAQSFWIIKHGIKLSGMPAWGLTHDDARIWALVSFLQRLPQLSAGEYRALTAPATAPATPHRHEGHSHRH